jgi:GWxTD domain-containing protein
VTAKPYALLLLALAFVGTAHAVEVDPGAALAGAKAQIAARKYAEAVSLLSPALEATDVSPDAGQQKQARTALHFYAAVAYSGLGHQDKASDHLQEALKLSPNLRNIDASQYSPQFVALFQRARPQTESGTGRFSELYPGLERAHVIQDKVHMWEDPALEILGSRKEKRDWQAAVSLPAREQFMADFWRRRDPTPETADENAYRDTFARRIAFADTAFQSPGQRGALSDRGRVFAVLGEPARVLRRALTGRDLTNLTALSRNGIGIEVGIIEHWIYTRDQLQSAGGRTITYRFVTHQGIGDYVLQKDGIAMNVLATATVADGRRD